MAKAKEIIIAIGSNFFQRKNIEYAKMQLYGMLCDDIVFSKDVWTQPIGINTDLFLNCICIATTKHNYNQIQNALKRVEKKCGRSLKNDRMGHIMLDLDILKFDGERFHEKDWEREYVSELIEDINMRIKEQEQEQLPDDKELYNEKDY